MCILTAGFGHDSPYVYFMSTEDCLEQLKSNVKSEHRLTYTRNCAITYKFRAEETELNGGRQPAICSALSEDCQWEGDADNCLMSPFPSACLNIEHVAPGCQCFD